MPEPEPTLIIDATRPIPASPIHYGLMTEELNHSYDGGLYAELVRNRAFVDDAAAPVHWSPVGKAAITLDPTQPRSEALPISLRIDAAEVAPGSPAGVANEGWWGIPVRPHTRYRASFQARAAAGFRGPITLALESPDGSVTYARATVDGPGPSWQEVTATLVTGDVTPTSDARLTLTMEHPGTLWLSLVSLFPPTWNDRPNGLRPDLMQWLIEVRPAFLRFPGGNYLEGNTIAERFDWKRTLGPLTERPGHLCPWGYRSSDGMGLLEFLLWAEDMGAEPVLGVYAGYSLKGECVPAGPELEPYVQDALDEIEYVTGPTTSPWGARRAADGRPEPFPLRYVEIGNEDWFDRSESYDARFTQFYDAIKARYPHLKVISTVGYERPGANAVRSRRPDVLDEHYYKNTAEFLEMARTQYDDYDRGGPEIFVGEWAAHEEIVPWDPRSRELPPTPNMWAALGDAAFMTAMERNADIVTMQAYAPLLVNVNPGARQWRPNLIGYDALRSYGSPSYHAIRLFSRHFGDDILPTVATDAAPWVSVTRERRTGTLYLKYVHPEPSPLTVRIVLQGADEVRSEATAIVLTAPPEATNSLDEPDCVVPVAHPVTGVGAEFTHTFPPHSITVLRIETRLPR